jgi:hypothetical protein
MRALAVRLCGYALTIGLWMYDVALYAAHLGG